MGEVEMKLSSYIVEYKLSHMKSIYLDSDVFDRIEKLESLSEEQQLVYKSIIDVIEKEDVQLPYSNAHMSDLMRGYKKTTKFIDGHLNNLVKYTNNLCLIQYWNQDNVVLHNRDVHEFFQDTIDESGFLPDSFEELYSDEGSTTEVLWSIKMNELRRTPIPSNVVSSCRMNPMLRKMYPTVIKHPNTLSLCQDLYRFALDINTDYSLYKNFKKFIGDSKRQFKAQKDSFQQIEEVTSVIPRQLDIDKLLNDAIVPSNTSGNSRYDEVMNLYFKNDLKGNHSDSRFANMIDDSLHVFYAAHCDVFISKDSKCRYKAKKVYEELGIKTKVYSPQEFYEGDDSI